MAYARTRRVTSRRSTVRRKVSYRRKAPYAKRRKVYRKRAMSKKRILNITSQKKRDDMVHDDTTGTPLRASILFNNQTNIIPFIPTARDIDPDGSKDYSRKSQTVYMRGFADRFTIQTNDATAWAFRYVAFRYKGPTILDGASPGTYFYNLNSVGGYNRAAGVYQPSSVPSLMAEVFKGTIAVDWLSPQTASLDPKTISIVKDMKFSVRSGNDNGTFARKTVWVPYNANLVYGGDEQGDKQFSSPLSTNGNAGKGDLYVVIFANAQGFPDETSRATILFDSTVYWHEK